jgi:hypothetical protein
MGVIDYGPPPDDCEQVLPPTSFAGQSWPFLASSPTVKELTYGAVFWEEARSSANLACNGGTCHGTGEDPIATSSEPLIPLDQAVLDARLDEAIEHLWTRIVESDKATRTGPMYGHHATNGTPEAHAEERWIEGNAQWDPKLAFVDQMMQYAHDCMIWRWYKQHETSDMLCPEDGGGGTDAGVDADGGGGALCVCRQPFTDAIASIDMEWANQRCASQ